MRKVNLLILLFLLATYGYAQTESFSERLGKTSKNIYSAVSENLRWYDIPVSAAYISGKYFAPDADDRIRVYSDGLDGMLQSHIGRSGRFTIGSMDKDLIPQSILLSRMIYNIGYDLFTDNTDGKLNHRHAFLFYKSLIYTYTLTEFAKHWTVRKRPDGTDSKSFFSGHSSTTFAAASFLFREANDFIDQRMPERSFKRFAVKTASFSVLYGWASFVAYSRMRDNKHYFSDVLIGALAGTAVSNLVYNDFISSKDKPLELSLGMINRAPSISLTIDF